MTTTPNEVKVGDLGTVFIEDRKLSRVFGGASIGNSVAVTVIAVRGGKIKVQDYSGYQGWVRYLRKENHTT